MIERRNFLLSAFAGAVLPAVASSKAPSTDKNFSVDLQDALSKSLADPALAAKLAPVLLDVGFNWEARSQPAASFRSIIAYSFGNRPAIPGSKNPAPGPVNQALAAAVIEAQRRSHTAIVYAQWEIASFLDAGEINAEVVPINPVVAPNGTVTYLSTDGVAQAAIIHAGDAAKLGRVCVIGHHDHAKRCVETSRARGMDAWAMQGLKLPADYDTQSDQPWTRNREIYLIHDMAAQLMQIRAKRIAELTSAS